jgi:hypothetical protein
MKSILPSTTEINVYSALNLRQSTYDGNSHFKSVHITIISYIILDLLMVIFMDFTSITGCYFREK